MEKKSKSGKILRIAISILVAVAVWLYVDSVKAPDVRVKVNHIPVEFAGENDTLADKGLMLLSGYDTTIDLSLKGPRKILWKLDKDEIRIVVDTAGINDTGVKTLRYTVVYPDAVSGSEIKVENASAFTVTVTVGELSTKEVPIECEVTGQIASGFIAGKLTLDPATLMLRASRDELVNVSYAKIELNISGANKKVVQAVGFTLYDYNDIVIENTNIRANVKLVQATMPVLMQKTVPLKLDFVEAPGSTMAQVKYQIQPEKVLLTGEQELLDSMEEIVLDTVYLQDLEATQNKTYEIVLPEGVVMSDQVDTAEVTISVSGVSERTITTSNIISRNLKEGFSAVLSTTELEVTVRGLTANVDQLKPSDVRVVADLSGVKDTGTHTVPATVEIIGENHVGAKGNYQVVVTVNEVPGE
ncbi:MAG: CdaR family protein [Eubacteriales bacterium]|nr:CdaR family protein [Eubacteriales bacterium]